LGAGIHDERHKGKADAYDVLEALEKKGDLFPKEIDYKRLELDRRRWDTRNFAEDLMTDARALFKKAWPKGATGKLVGVPVRVVVESEAGFAVMYVAISEKPTKGSRSGLSFPLTQERFLLIQEGMREAAVSFLDSSVAAEELHDRRKFPGGLHQERGFLLFFET
jgi:hypothetical protein